MPKPFQFKSGSLIYFQGDDADRVFILQSGKVSLVYQNIETGEDMKDQVSAGEFFGVKSALGHFPREENAIALADSSIMAFTVPEFENLAMANTRIIMKMLKVFSNQMRRIHNQVSSLMAKADVKPDEGLFNAGEYYLKNKRYSQAKYVFSRYLTYYPSGKNAARAAKKLEEAENAAAGQSGETIPAPKARPAQAAEKAVQPLPLVTTVPASAVSTKAQSETAKAYYDAISFISLGKYQQAFLAFKKIVDADDDPEWTVRSSYELGRCIFFLNKYDDCIQHFTAMLTKYPKHPDLKDAMYFIGQCHEKNGKKGQAAAFYKKILSMADDPDDEAATRARRALQAIGGG